MIRQIARRSWVICQEIHVQGDIANGASMTRYFFDVRAKTATEFDYHGRFLPTLDHAQQMAELIAMDLGCTRVDGSFGMEVQIRTAAGMLLCSVPVNQMDALAA
jgi:hypothetical protein